MKDKTKIFLTLGIIAVICLGLLGFSTTQGWIYETGTAEARSIPGKWTIASVSPYIGDYAVGVTAAGDSIYIANSDGWGHFMRYNTSTGDWDDLKMLARGFRNSVAMAWDKGNHIYVLPGASYPEVDGGGIFLFFRYNIAADTWTKLQRTPHTNGAGDALAFVPGWVLNVSNDNFIYAILGSNRPSGSRFYRYSITNNNWSALLSFPWSSTDDGCSLVWAGDNYLYALRGEYIESSPSYEFWRYDLVNDNWVRKKDIPAGAHSGGSGGVGDGGSLLWIGGNFSDYIYALSGNQAFPEPIWDKRFYHYSITRDVWERLANLPEGVGDQNGPRLGFANGNIYAWRGCNNDGSLYEYQLDVTPPEITIISPGNKTYDTSLVPLTFTVNESTSWATWMGYSLDGRESETITGNMTLTSLTNGSHSIVVYARDLEGNVGFSEKVYFKCSFIHDFDLVTLYKVHLHLNETFLEGNNLTIIFYSYSSYNQEANATIWNRTTTDHVNMSINITHPLNKAIKNATLVLTDSLGNIWRVISFVVRQSDLMTRVVQISLAWPSASGGERLVLFEELVAIDMQWPYAPP